MVQLAILIAIVILLTLTPLGYLKIGPIEATLMGIPVSVAAMILGPSGGAILGLAFGLTSFFQCFGTSALGVFLLGVSPFLTAVTCIVPRVLCGWIPGLLFRVMRAHDRTRIVSYVVTGLLTAILNTILFVGCILLFFWHNAAFISQMQAWSISTDTIWLFIVAFVGVNGIAEAAVCAVVGGAAGKAVDRFLGSSSRKM